jgi:hypothetical protein
MTRGERNFLIVLTAIGWLTVAVVVMGLKLLDASDEMASTALVCLLAIDGLVGAFAFDRYTTPPEER